jgi:hypothetical protein
MADQQLATPPTLNSQVIHGNLRKTGYGRIAWLLEK